MFTGIIEETGHIRTVTRGRHSSILSIGAAEILADLKTGDSVSVNGVCLTATTVDGGGFTADVMHETLDRSTLGQLAAGDIVNLERAMPAGGRFGGHIVSGHIDGVGRVVSVRRDDNAVWYTVEAPPELRRYIVEKGSIAVDGISLTVARVDARTFAVSVIPHTLGVTTLGARRVGSGVNLETDIIGKYVESLLRSGPAQSTITREFLAQNGF
ncbi:MAG: riboflavin synthase [Oscillibacter sp.]|nr:riboflavin synthase [Oscillibacter sp.]